MQRRGFLAALAGLPFVGRLIAKEPAKDDIDFDEDDFDDLDCLDIREPLGGSDMTWQQFSKLVPNGDFKIVTRFTITPVLVLCLTLPAYAQVQIVSLSAIPAPPALPALPAVVALSLGTPTPAPDLGDSDCYCGETCTCENCDCFLCPHNPAAKKIQSVLKPALRERSSRPGGSGASISTVPRPASTLHDRLLTAHNAVRARRGIHPLRLNYALAQTAQVQADWLARTTNSNGHRGPPGQEWVQQRIRPFAYRWTALGENVAGDWTGPNGLGPTRSTPEDTVTSWLQSPGHAATLLSNQYTEVGFAMAAAPSGYRNWVAVYARPSESSLPSGVASRASVPQARPASLGNVRLTTSAQNGTRAAGATGAAIAPVPSKIPDTIHQPPSTTAATSRAGVATALPPARPLYTQAPVVWMQQPAATMQCYGGNCGTTTQRRGLLGWRR